MGKAVHTFNKSVRRVSMSVVTDGILSTHWQYSRMILINSKTVLEEKDNPQTLIKKSNNQFKTSMAIYQTWQLYNFRVSYKTLIMNVSSNFVL